MIDLQKISLDPGCYMFKDSAGEIIYVGKAKSLRKRVSSYFSNSEKDAKTQKLAGNIADVEFFVTSSEVEALILENNLIKKHKPKYNIDLKDSKRFARIVVTHEKFPRMLVARDRAVKGRYYGPFVNAQGRDAALKTLRKTFGIRTCNRMPKRECLKYHIGLCPAPCTGRISEEEYQKNVRCAEKYLAGSADELIDSMRDEMNDAAGKMDFERAAILRDRIYALTNLHEKQKMEREKRYDEDVINYAVSGETIYLMVFNVLSGMLASKQEFSFDLRENFLDEFTARYYADNDVPREIILPEALSDDSVSHYLETLRGGKVTLTVPQRGEKKELLDLVLRNVEATFLSQTKALSALRDALRLPRIPRVIECFDISNTQGSNSVGSMVRFVEGSPDKSGYRRFRVKTVAGSDDFASIAEVVKRRYSRLKGEGGEMPDLVVIDGGAGQLKAAMAALRSADAKAPVVSLAKRFEEIHRPKPGAPIKLGKDDPALKLLVRIRDEAHRFAITYHRLLRSKEMVEKGRGRKY
ncbi:MAG: excinuclease ABC subunit C [Thermoplasmata archaeon HGW-Thermoplasmata-1]|nr:MAG: excinuclease ABC subunit C [Thermoplasmata archaeon HGW-Thermoplasmata-1]